MNDAGNTAPQEQHEQRGVSVILLIIGAGFVLLGLAWGWEFIKVLTGGTLDTLEEWRGGAYAITYVAAGIGMLLHARWAAWAVVIWSLITVSQFIYPPAPREEVPLYAQIAVALIVLFWTLGLTFYVRRRTHAVHHNDQT